MDEVIQIHIRSAVDYLNKMIFDYSSRLTMYDMQWGRESDDTRLTAERLEDKLEHMRQTRDALLKVIV